MADSGNTLDFNKILMSGLQWH